MLKVNPWLRTGIFWRPIQLLVWQLVLAAAWTLSGVVGHNFYTWFSHVAACASAEHGGWDLKTSLARDNHKELHCFCNLPQRSPGLVSARVTSWLRFKGREHRLASRWEKYQSLNIQRGKWGGQYYVAAISEERSAALSYTINSKMTYYKHRTWLLEIKTIL